MVMENIADELVLDRMIPLETNMKTGNDSCTTATYSLDQILELVFGSPLFFF
jgi:hypothetical protein